MTHEQEVIRLMQEQVSTDPLVLEKWLDETVDQEHKVLPHDALRIGLLQLYGTREALVYLAKQVDKLDATSS